MIGIPAYDFECPHCGHKFTVRTSMRERKNVSCPQCAGTDMRQLITGFMTVPKSSDNCSGGCSTGGQGGFS
ncbi:MAG: FmdB family zinc ribbon protein [Bacillota bacterium]